MSAIKMSRWVKVNNFETLMKLGVYAKEQIKAQRVIIDILLEVNVNSHDDNIKNVLSYEKIIEIINNISKQNHKYLAETVAENIAIKCLELDRAKSVHVSLKKPDIISGKTEEGVEVKLNK